MGFGICFHHWDLGFSCCGGGKFVACSRFVFGPFDLKMVDSCRSLHLFGTLFWAQLWHSRHVMFYISSSGGMRLGFVCNSVVYLLKRAVIF